MQNSRYPEKRPLADQEAPLCLITLLLILAGQTLQGGVEEQIGPLSLSAPGAYTFLSYAAAVFSGLAVLLFMALYKADRPLLRLLLPGGRNRLRMLPAGLLVGLALNLLCAAAALLSGSLTLTPASPELLWLLLCLPAVFLQSASEELACRFFMFCHLKRGRGAVSAVLVPSLLFTVLHLLNPDVTPAGAATVFLAGLFFALCMLRYESFFLVAGLHTAWNFCQAVLLGLPNSGIPAVFGLFIGDSPLPSPGFFYDPGFGLEGSVFAALVLLAACAALLVPLIREGAFRRAEKEKDGEASAS